MLLGRVEGPLARLSALGLAEVNAIIIEGPRAQCFYQWRFITDFNYFAILNILVGGPQKMPEISRVLRRPP